MPKGPKGEKRPAAEPGRKGTEADPEQYARFVEKARELGCEDDPAAFDRMFERIVPPKRKPKGEAEAEPPQERKRKLER